MGCLYQHVFFLFLNSYGEPLGLELFDGEGCWIHVIYQVHKDVENDEQCVW